MADMIVDLTNYKDRVGSRVEPGRYRVQIEDIENTRSNAGNPMMNIQFRVMGGEFDGQTIVDRLAQTEKAMFRTVGFLQALGVPTPKKKLKLNTQNLVGKVMEIDVEDGEPYQGRVRSEVRGYNRVSKKDEPKKDELEDIEETEEDEAEPAEAVSEPEPDDSDDQGETGQDEEDRPAKKPKQKKKAEDDSDDEIDLDEVEL